MRPALFCLPLALACGDGPVSPATELETSVSLSEAVVTPGDSITVTLTLTNPTAGAIQVSGTSPCFLTFSVQPAGGAEVAADPRPCPAVITSATLQPGESRQASIRWGLTAGGTPLPLGQYTVRAGLSLVNQQGLQVPSLPQNLQVVVFGG